MSEGGAVQEHGRQLHGLVMADATQTSTETFFVDLSGATGPGGPIRIQDGTAHGTIRWLN